MNKLDRFSFNEKLLDGILSFRHGEFMPLIQIFMRVCIADKEHMLLPDDIAFCKSQCNDAFISTFAHSSIEDLTLDFHDTVGNDYHLVVPFGCSSDAPWNLQN